MMSENAVISEFQEANALLKGHFILSSGRHSDTYLQCARLLMDPQRSERLCKALVQKFQNIYPAIHADIVVSPAMGGVVVGYEVARQMNLNSIFCERENGAFTLRRGFSLPQGARVIVVEDVVTTGKSSLESFNCVREFGAEIVAEICLVDRSNGMAAKELGVPFVSLITLAVESYAAAEVPENLAKIPAIKPGSRWLGKANSSA
jgi:orotate phosphoribosyltransferase